MAGDEGAARRRRGRRRLADGVRSGLRFAFYGRMSTEEYQDRVTSLRWQREMAEETIAGRGLIVVEYFDEGWSRRVSWCERPAAAALLDAVRSPGRSFDAVVVGEYERAFCDDQFQSVSATLREHGVQVWLPEAGGLVDWDSPTHRALVLLLGAQSRREVVRTRHRVWAAMRVQTVVQGRFLGGRPPYGYRLVDAGPHPNQAHARWGRRAHRLAPDPVTGPWVRWIFGQRAAGRSVAGIARELNERGVPCPSSADRARNRHRSGEAWLVPTVIGILENPRYTGRQVWNRHGSLAGQDELRPSDGSGLVPARGCIVSDRIVHPPLVEETVFRAVQGMRVARRTRDGGTRRYVLAGLVVCGVCRRRLDSHWVNGRAGYRCRHGYTSARPRPAGHAKNVYAREDRLLSGLRDRVSVGAGETGDEVAAYLRSNRLVIVCRASSWALERVAEASATSEPGEQLTLMLG